MKQRIKICGITRPEDAILSANLGAWALGFILWPGSKRNTNLHTVRKIKKSLTNRVPEKLVAVTVNASQEELQEIIASGLFTSVQFHGDEDPSQLQGFPLETIKAFRIGNSHDLLQIQHYNSNYSLLDAKVPGSYGGTGKQIDWRLVAESSATKNLILSGGINPANIQDAISIVTPFAVDLSSGVESSPGIKSEAKLKALFQNL